MEKKQRKLITLSLETQYVEQLKELAELTGQSMTGYIRTLLIREHRAISRITERKEA